MKCRDSGNVQISSKILFPFLLLLCAGLFFYCVGCQSSLSDRSSNTAQPSNSTGEASESSTSSTSAIPSSQQSTATSKMSSQTGSSRQNALFSKSDLLIHYAGQTFRLLEDASGLIELLGDNYIYSEADSCVFDGMDKTFDYGFVLVYTVPQGSTDLLDGFDILDSNTATGKGITVGSTIDDVLDAYGQPASDDYDWVYNETGDSNRVGDPRLTISFDDADRVSYISYYSGSNAEN